MVNHEVFTWARWTASSRVASVPGRARPPVAAVLSAPGGARDPRPRRLRDAPRKSGVPRDGGTPGDTGGRGPVVLATVRGAPLAPDATRVAIDLAGGTGRPLVVVDVSSRFGAGRTVACHGSDPGAAAGLCDAAHRATAAGVVVQVLGVTAAHPLHALAEVVSDLAPAALVLGAEPGSRRADRLTPRAYRRLARRLEARTTCLLWCPAAGPALGAARERPVAARP